MTKVKEEQVSLAKMEENLIEKQSHLEKQKLEYDEEIIKKDQLIIKVSIHEKINCTYLS